MISIQTITADDIADVIGMLKEFAEFENLTEWVSVTAERLTSAMFGENSFVEGLIARDGTECAGYAIFFNSFATFRGQRGLFLEDLFVREEHRGTGLGKLFLRRIAAMAKDRGGERIDFHVLDWNKPALSFYQRLGAVSSDDELHYMFTDSAFRALST